MPTKDELKLQKERIRLAQQAKKVFNVQKEIEKLEHKILKYQNKLEKEQKKAQDIKDTIYILEEKIKLQHSRLLTTGEAKSIPKKRLKGKRVKRLPAPKDE
ncbi:MAG: hypothetical protein HWN67_07565 [Candidatus Helarchaeota archaeon]|nr:hypothetical protein [Candidatus Helarchaeota archaeon]